MISRDSTRSSCRAIAWPLVGSWLIACGGLSNDEDVQNRGGNGGTSVGGTTSSGGSGSGGRAGAASGGVSGEAATGGVARGGVAGQAGSGSGGTAGRSLEEICSGISAGAQDEIYRIISADQPCETDADCTRIVVRKSCAWLCPSAGTLLTAADLEKFTSTSCQEFDSLGCPEVMPPLCPNSYAACVEGSCEEVPG